MHPLAKLDNRHVWHPFTQMRDWLKTEPIVIAEGKGAVLRDIHGREYLDANSSIWTNLHGHRHRKIDAALQRQLKKIAHSSALGLANEPASLLAKRLVEAANPARVRSAIDGPDGRRNFKSKIADQKLAKVFFSDDGSTAMEVALKMAHEVARRLRGKKRPAFLSVANAYHGDTIGATSLGHIDFFHRPYSKLVFKTDTVMAPYCYRCPYNRAKPERAEAREYRKCNWQCLGKLEEKFERQKQKRNGYAAFVIEPLIQGAAGMIAHPAGWLRRAAEVARAHGTLLIADEVMTGFGRTSGDVTERVSKRVSERNSASHSLADTRAHLPSLFACHHEGVQPDFLALGKGMTGGYLPMAATLTTQETFHAFLGDYDEFKTFFHGHSYTANQLGAAAALANLDILQSPASIRARKRLEGTLREELKTLWKSPNVGDVRQVGLVAGIELVRDWRTREPFDLREQAGIRVCSAMVREGILTRPIGNVIVLMPPYCTTDDQVRRMVEALCKAIRTELRVKD